MAEPIGNESKGSAAPPDKIVPRSHSGDETPGAASAPAPAHAPARPRRFTALRAEVPFWQSLLLGALCLALCLGLWWGLTRGDIAEERFLGPTVLPSPSETFADFPGLWFDHALTRNTLVSLQRVVLGFGLAALVGIPVGVLCGCFRRVGAFLAPLMIGGRNIPVAAVIPLTLSFFGINEFQKIMFIFIACVAFVIMDTATAIADVSDRYIDTAYTLGATHRQIVMKVLVPLAMPSIFNSLRLLFGLAFGYIMLAEVIQTGGRGGLGSIINMAQKRSQPTYILLVLMLIPLVALAIDRLLFWVQRQLFPYQYGGDGLLHRGVRATMRAWEAFWAIFFRPVDAAPTFLAPPSTRNSDAATPGKKP
jgi:NitT/TauT family transport system permease protein